MILLIEMMIMTNIEPVKNNLPPVKDALSSDEAFEIQIKLWNYMSRQIKLYTVGDSSSVPIETAQELLHSMVFTINLALKEKGLAYSSLLSLDIEETLALGLEVIKRKIEEGKALLEAVCLSAPEIDNISYWDTYKGIQFFFKKYNSLFIAHQIPCDIDYQLCHPVSESFLGIEYINEYLRHVSIENSILKLFDSTLVTSLLKRCYTDYVDLPVNLCEPVIINAAGLIFIDKSPFALNFSSTDIAVIISKLSQMTETESLAALTNAGKNLCSAFGIENGRAANYVIQTVASINHRLRTAVGAGDISNIFIPF